MTQKILIVDDDVLMHLLYRQHLERAGYQLIVAADGQEAMETAARELPSLIFMDVMIPGINGLSALRELKKADATKAIPVVVISSNVTTYNASRKEAEQSGAAGYLSKPFSPAQLMAEVQRLLPP